jgi:hypothetical protein
MKHNDLPPGVHCPACHKKLDACSGVDHEQKPSEGCVSICIGCGVASIFTRDLQLRTITDKELRKHLAGVTVNGRPAYEHIKFVGALARGVRSRPQG